MTEKILMFRLEGVLQSWGEHSKFDYRDSGDFPTKSAIVGMIGCALGIPRNDVTLEEISNTITIAVRCDRRGNKIEDFHTVSADGKILSSLGKERCKTIVTRRTYLEDYSFLVGLRTNEAFAQQICDAFRNPVWPVYLGRKSCVPSIPILPRIGEGYSNLHEAMENHEINHIEFKQGDQRMILYEMDSEDNSGYERQDDIFSAENRQYIARTVTTFRKEC